MGGGRLCRRVLPDEALRSESNSRRHSQTGVQDTTDQTRHAGFVDFRSDAFGFGVAAGAKVGLTFLPQLGGSACAKAMTGSRAIALRTTRSTLIIGNVTPNKIHRSR